MATELENLVPEADVEVEGMRGPKGDKGDSYALTEADKEEIARKVDKIIDAETDKTLSISGKPADAKAVGDAIDDLKADLSNISDDVYARTLMTAGATSTGWKLKDNGYCASDSSYKMDKYQVTSCDVVKIVSDHLFQFQTSSSVPSGGSLNRVGDTYGVGAFTLAVPSTATYLIVSTTISDSGAAVYEVSSKIEDLTELVDAIPNVVDSAIKDKHINYITDMVSLIKSGSIQLIDPSQYVVKTASSYKYFQYVVMPMTQNGLYYANPIGAVSLNQMKFYDANNNQLTITNSSGSTVSYISLEGYRVIERVDDTHLTVYTYSNEANFYNGSVRQVDKYTLSGNVEYSKIDSIRHLSSKDDMGITFGEHSRVYIPYGLSHEYNPELLEATWNYFLNKKKYYDIPAKRLNPWMQRSYAITDNLLDDRKIDWGVTSGNYYPMKYGETVPVEGGRTIVCSKNMYSVRWYDSNGTETSLSNGSRFTLPASAVAIRFDIWRGTGDAAVPIDEYQPVYLYYADSRTLYTYDDVDRNPVPMAQINGWDINKNVYDMAIPEVTSNIVRMMKTFAIRELNHQRNAFRIGTFNIYINNTRTNRPTIKKELETYGIDICCFQEARNLDDNNNQLNIGDYLKGWQFGYCNTNEMSTTSGSQTGRAMVSAYEVLSSEEVVFTDNTSNSYLKCVIQLPRYKDYVDGLTTLSLYTYHGKVDSATTRALEVAQILTAIASDTSDFIVVTGDTNDFSANKDIWAQFQAAGLTPVHDGKSTTVTDRSQTIDQIFVSSNITCLYYDVINSGEWMYKPTPMSNPQPVSDHDLLYADLQFDFEAVIEARNNS